MTTDKDDIKNNCLILLPTDMQISENRLNLYIDIVYQRILNYCRRSDFPEALILTASQMVVDLIVENQTTQEESRVSSISEGGRTVSFDMKGVSIQADEKISKLTELREFRKLYRA